MEIEAGQAVAASAAEVEVAALWGADAQAMARPEDSAVLKPLPNVTRSRAAQGLQGEQLCVCFNLQEARSKTCKLKVSSFT